MPHLVFILFLFALGACVGSFLNVVVWRLPRIETRRRSTSADRRSRAVNPPSHCPKCDTPLKWYDNLPVIGWIKLGGKCRYCRQPISPRYPIVEAITGLLFVFYYVMFFIVQIGPCAAADDDAARALGTLQMMPRRWTSRATGRSTCCTWSLIAALLAASLIDAELFIIPIEIPWLIGGRSGSSCTRSSTRPSLPGALNVAPAGGARSRRAGRSGC